MVERKSTTAKTWRKSAKVAGIRCRVLGQFYGPAFRHPPRRQKPAQRCKTWHAIRALSNGSVFRRWAGERAVSSLLPPRAGEAG